MINPKSKLTFDWTLNVSNIITVILFLIGGIGAWYDVKYEVAGIQKESAIKFKEIDKFVELQRGTDAEQNQARERALSEIRESLREQGREIKQEIRDFRNDLMRNRTPR